MQHCSKLNLKGSNMGLGIKTNTEQVAASSVLLCENMEMFKKEDSEGV